MNLKSESKIIIPTILKHYPEVQAIYLFGSRAMGNEWPDSDVDIAVLLPPVQAKSEKNLAFSDCCYELMKLMNCEVDLLNARLVSTVFQKEILATGWVIYCADQYAMEEFEMLTLSYYQKLNEERKEILQSFNETGRAYAV